MKKNIRYFNLNNWKIEPDEPKPDPKALSAKTALISFLIMVVVWPTANFIDCSFGYFMVFIIFFILAIINISDIYMQLSENN